MVLRVFLVLFQGFVVGATIGVGFLETLVAAIVPVDGIDRGCQSAYDERQFPVTFVIDLCWLSVLFWKKVMDRF